MFRFMVARQVGPVSDLWQLYRVVAEHRTAMLPDGSMPPCLDLGAPWGREGGGAGPGRTCAARVEGDPVTSDLLEGCRCAPNVAEHLEAPDPAGQLHLARERLARRGTI